MSTIDGYLTPHEAAEKIGVSHSQVTRYVNEGRISHIRVGQNILIPQKDVAEFERPPRGNPKFQKK